MPFLLLIALLTACVPMTWRPPIFPWSSSVSVIMTGSGVLLHWSIAILLARRYTRMIETEPWNLALIMSRYGRWRSLHHLFGICLFVACLGLFGWGWAVGNAAIVTTERGPILIPGTELAVLSPFFLLVIGSWFWWYPVERAAMRITAYSAHSTRPVPGRIRFVLFYFRQYALLFALPLALMITRQGLDRLYPELFEGSASRGALLAFMVGLVLVYPLALRPILGLERMPSGPIRDRFEAHAHRLKIRFRELLLWNTNGTMANAMVVGFVAPVRYLIFTDRLLNDLSEEEVEAVFGHEIGHIKHGHLGFYGLFLLLSLLAFSAIWTETILWLNASGYGWLSQYEEWFLGGQLLAMIAYFFIVFGFLSRRCERQADIFGCRVASGTDDRLTPEGIDTFIHALEKVSKERTTTTQNSEPSRSHRLGWVGRGIRQSLRWMRSWQHATVARRVEFLHRMKEDRDLEPAFQRRLFWIKWTVAGALTLLVIALGTTLGWEKLVQAM